MYFVFGSLNNDSICIFIRISAIANQTRDAPYYLRRVCIIISCVMFSWLIIKHDDDDDNGGVVGGKKCDKAMRSEQ